MRVSRRCVKPKAAQCGLASDTLSIETGERWSSKRQPVLTTVVSASPSAAQSTPTLLQQPMSLTKHVYTYPFLCKRAAVRLSLEQHVDNSRRTCYVRCFCGEIAAYATEQTDNENTLSYSLVPLNAQEGRRWRADGGGGSL